MIRIFLMRNVGWYDTQDALYATRAEAARQMSAVQTALEQTDDQLRHLNEQIHYAGQYLATRQVQTSFLKSSNKKQFREEHHEELEKYNAARQYFKEHSGGSIPSLKALKEERSRLQETRKEQRTTYDYFAAYHKELDTACMNVESILHQPDRSISIDAKKA